MNETQATLAQNLLKAIQAEYEGYHFYSMAAKNAEDPKGKEVFAQLAQDEMGHFEFLKKHYRSVLDTGAPAENIALGARPDLSEASPIFSDGIKDRIGDAHYEMTALSVGAQLERDAQAFYSEAADEAGDPVVEAFFRELARWEQGHHEALIRQMDLLKDDYWSAAGFAPF